jgi:hypothetical protein
VHVLTTAKLQPLCIHMMWRCRNALCSIKTMITEEMVFGLLNIADEPLLTEVTKQGLIFKIRSGLVSGNFTWLEGAYAKRYIKLLAKYLRLAWLWRHFAIGSTSKMVYKIIGKLLTISLAVAALRYREPMQNSI